MTNASTKPTGNVSLSGIMSSKGLLVEIENRTANHGWKQTLAELNLGYQFV